MHVHGYRERGNINTPFELAIINGVDRYTLAIDVIDRVPRIAGSGAHTKEWLKNQIIESVRYAHEEGIDRDEIREWTSKG
jgi:xylulose-5-phosphate/fructose-6-phosphate phosphoketolase